MRSGLLTLALCGAAASLGAQATLRVNVGATASSALVNDEFLLTKVRMATPAPTAGLAVSIPSGGGYRIVLEADLRHAGLDAVNTNPNTATGTADRIASLTTIDGLALGEGHVRGPLHWQVGGGIVWYRPSGNEGVFQDGPGSSWVLTAGLVWIQPLRPGWNLTGTGRLDYQSFSTQALVDRGYIGGQAVHRFTLAIGLERVL